MTQVTHSHQQMPGYLALPGKDRGTGILVLHAWWGLNDTTRAVCERLATEGYVAYAPDLYHGQVAVTIKEAERLSNSLDEERAKRDIADAVELLCEHIAPDGCVLGVVGFSLGAYFALELANDDPDRMRAVVLFYGTGERGLAKSTAAYLGHFAENDDFEPAEEVDGLETALKVAGRPVTFHRYVGVGHWFAEPDRTRAYDEAAARLAWERTIAFLKNALPAS
jgi:carboxymethylenebutenolidase